MLLIDLHRHLEGSLRPSTVLECARRDGHWLLRCDPATEQLTTTGRLPGLLPYLDKIDNAVSALSRESDWARAGREAVADAAADGLDYVELRFAPGLVSRTHGLSPEAVIDAISDGAEAASAEHGPPVGLIGILVRTFGPETADDDLEAVLRRQDRFVGIDLAGDEHGWPPELFTRHFGRARTAGLRTTAHAGEAAGPASVLATVEHLAPERIGHGTRSAEDPRLVERLAREGIGLELALTSNVHTATAPSVETHPIAELIEAEVPVTLNTDNPTVSGTTLTAEHLVAARAGLTDDDLRRAAANARHLAFRAIPPRD